MKLAKIFIFLAFVVLISIGAVIEGRHANNEAYSSCWNEFGSEPC